MIMKIAYIGKIQLADTDLSYLNAAQIVSDITYFMEVTPRYLKGPAFNISKIYPHCGLFKAVEIYPEFAKYSNFIDINKFYVLNTCGKLWQLKAIWTNLMFLLYLIKNKFSVIHLTWPANIYELFIYILGRKTILTVHDPFPHSGLDTKIVRLRRKLAFKYCKYFILLNKAQKAEFIKYYNIDPNRVIISHLSCCNFLKVSNKDCIQTEDKRYILFSGKISQYKGLNYLLPAMVKVHEKIPNVTLIIAGSGKFNFDISPYKDLPYISIINRYITDEELVSLIKGSQFIVCPYTDATQSGVIMSAYAFDTPVIATNVGGLPEMLANGALGLIIKERSVDALVQCICSLLLDDKKLEEYRKNIHDRYTSNGILSWTTIATEIKKAYEKISNCS